MRLASPQRRPAQESVIPMINVVFLLLVFFLITAKLAPPLPVEIEPPTAEGAELDSDPDTLVIDAEGTVYWMEVTGEAALDALAMRDSDAPLTLRADRALEAATLARLLAGISAVVDTPVYLVVES